MKILLCQWHNQQGNVRSYPCVKTGIQCDFLSEIPNCLKDGDYENGNCYTVGKLTVKNSSIKLQYLCPQPKAGRYFDNTDSHDI